jgi:hypothetical protein
LRGELASVPGLLVLWTEPREVSQEGCNAAITVLAKGEPKVLNEGLIAFRESPCLARI